MQIVIDIPETAYEYFAQGMRYTDDVEMAIIAIVDGTPLPKEHGRLIDADKLLGSDGIIADSRKCHYIPMIDVYQAPTIIEADKAESEDKA